MELTSIPMKYYVDDLSIVPVFSVDIKFMTANRGQPLESKNTKLILATAGYKNSFIIGTEDDYLGGHMLTFDIQDSNPGMIVCIDTFPRRILIDMKYVHGSLVASVCDARTPEEKIPSQILLTPIEIVVLKKQLKQAVINHNNYMSERRSSAH